MNLAFDNVKPPHAENCHYAVLIKDHRDLGIIFLAKDLHEAVDWMKIREQWYNSKILYDTVLLSPEEISLKEEQYMLKRERITYHG